VSFVKDAIKDKEETANRREIRESRFMMVLEGER